LAGTSLLAAGLEEVWAPTNLVENSARDSAHHLPFATETEETNQVISLTEVVWGGPYRIFLLKPNTSLRKIARYLWFDYRKKVARDPPGSYRDSETSP